MYVRRRHATRVRVVRSTNPTIMATGYVGILSGESYRCDHILDGYFRNTPDLKIIYLYRKFIQLVKFQSLEIILNGFCSTDLGHRSIRP